MQLSCGGVLADPAGKRKGLSVITLLSVMWQPVCGISAWWKCWRVVRSWMCEVPWVLWLLLLLLCCESFPQLPPTTPCVCPPPTSTAAQGVAPPVRAGHLLHHTVEACQGGALLRTTRHRCVWLCVAVWMCLVLRLEVFVSRAQALNAMRAGCIHEASPAAALTVTMCVLLVLLLLLPCCCCCARQDDVGQGACC
jgi:hypothetical protein